MLVQSKDNIDFDLSRVVYLENFIMMKGLVEIPLIFQKKCPQLIL